VIASLVERCVSFMAQRGAFPDTEEQREIYSYGMELQIYYIINTVLLLALGFLFGRFVEVALFLFLFGLMQSYGGGYHANTHGRCLAIMTCGVLLFLVLLPLYQGNMLLQAISVLAGLATVICLAPVAHKNHPLDPEKSKRMGKRAKLWALLMAAVWGLLLLLTTAWATAADVIAMTLAFTTLSMLAATVKKLSDG